MTNDERIINMAEYHVGCGIAGIYAGTLKNEYEWKNKSECTVEASLAVAHYLLEHNKIVKFTQDGQKYVMKVEKVVNNDEE